MLATLTDAPFDDKEWVFEDKYDGFRMVATIEDGEVTLYSRNGKIITQNYIEVTRALEGIKHDAVIDGELIAIDRDGVSHYRDYSALQPTETACVLALAFCKGESVRKQVRERDRVVGNDLRNRSN
jgi:bifunctional non-homologous end joining protein LigD